MTINDQQLRNLITSAMTYPPSWAGYKTIGQAVEEYSEHAARNGKHVAKPLGQYNYHCRSACHDVRICDFKPENAEALKQKMLTHGLSPQSVVHALAFIRRAINYSTPEGESVPNPFRSTRNGVFQLPVIDNKRERYFTPIEAAELLDRLEDRHHDTYQMSLLSLHTGLRACEIFRMKFEDIDEDAGIIHVTGKGGRRQFVHAPAEIIDMLIKRPFTISGLVFTDKRGRKLERISYVFGDLVSELGMQSQPRSRYRVTFHTWRHTFASWLAQSGKVTLYELMTLMRHANISMTQRYAHLIPSETFKKTAYIDTVLKKAARRR